MSARVQHNTWIWIALATVLVAGALIILPTPSAVVVIGGVLLALALLRWREIALYIAIVAVPFGSWFPIAISVGNLTAVDIAVALLIVLWLARMIALERDVTIRFPPLSFPFVLFIFAALLSITGASSLQFALKELAKWIEMFAVYVYVANDFDQARLKRALAVIFFAGLAEAAIGIYQFLFQWGPKGFLLFGSFIRAFGTFEQPNPFAGYLALILPVALGVVLGSMFELQGFKLTTKRTLNFKLGTLNLVFVILAALALATMLAAVVMSWSRGAWLGVAGGLIVTVIVQSRRAFMLTIIAAFVLTFVILLSSINVIPDVIAARFSGIADYFGVFDVRGVKVDDANFAVVERMAHWQAAWGMLHNHPLLGVGIGNYAAVYPEYALPRWDDPLGHAHNYYLNVAAETGFVGLAAYLVLWAAAFWQSWRAVRGSRGLWQSVAAGLLGMLVALSAHNLFDNLFVHGMAVQVGIGLGMMAVINNDKSQITNEHNAEQEA
jgi:putative inorganic carbon (hco3(-)) transporter